MVDSADRKVITRREAMILSSTAGLTLVSGGYAVASDSIKTAAHQEPGNLSTPRSFHTTFGDSQDPVRQSARLC